MTLDLDFIRSQFPGLNRDFVFMDNAGGSQIASPVVDRMNAYLFESNVQHGASYAVSREATARVADATAIMADYVNAPSPEEIVLGPSTSMLIRILSLGMVKQWQPGDEVIITNTDHEANVSPWTDLEKQGIVVKTWKFRPETMALHTEDLATLFSPRTRLVAVTHSSNILGTINPVREISDLVHQHGALICVDGVAFAPHRMVDVQSLNVDFYIFSLYKVFGPHYALMYGRKDLLDGLEGINHYFIQSTPYKFQPGSVNYEMASSLQGLTDYLEKVGNQHQIEGKGKKVWKEVFNAFSLHEEKLATRFMDFLKGKKDVEIIGSSDPSKETRVPTIAFSVKGRDSKDIVDQVDPHRIGIRYGDFYAKKLIHDLGLEEQNGVVRVSMVHYNTLEEVERLIEVLDEFF